VPLLGTLLLGGCNMTLLNPTGQVGLEQRNLIITAIRWRVRRSRRARTPRRCDRRRTCAAAPAPCSSASPSRSRR
jgi:hypothetical protein